MAVSRFRRRLLYTVSGAAILAGSMLAGWPEGLAVSFEDTVFRIATGYYGSVVVKSYDGTQRYIGPPAKLLDYSSPSVKLCRGPDGNLRYGAHNLILQSETFDNATWAKVNSTITANSSVAPDGTLTASILHENTTNGFHRIDQVVATVAGSRYVFSCWVKQWNETPRVNLEVSDSASGANGGSYAIFDVLTGATIESGGYQGGTLHAAGVEQGENGWFRFYIDVTVTTSSSRCWVRTVNASNQTVYPGSTNNGLFVWRAHLRRSPSDDTYLKTTDAAVYELPYEWGVNEFVNPDSPETQVISVDDESSYTVVVEGPGSVSLSGAAAGTVAAGLARTFKMDGTSLTVTVNGSPTFVHVREALGIRVEEQRTNLFLNNRAPVTQNITVTAQAYTLSFYGTGSITLSGAYSDTLEGTGENERVTLTFTPEAGTLTCTVDGDIDFVQLEAGAFATSPIETAGSTVTRAGDNISLATSKFPFSADEGTIIVAYWGLQKSSQTSNDLVVLSPIAPGSFIVIGTSNGWYTNGIGLGLGNANSVNKKGIAFDDAGNFAGSINGSSPTTSTSSDWTGTSTRLHIGSRGGSREANVHIRSLLYLPREVSGIELQTLTGV